MPSTDDEHRATMLAERIVDAGNRGVWPGPDDLQALAALVESQSQELADALRRLRDQGASISAEDMLQMQMLMNKLSQLSEFNTSIINAANRSMTSMARHINS